MNDDPRDPEADHAALAHADADAAERYRAIFEQSPFGIAIFDAALHLLDCNEYFATLLGFSRELMRGFDLTQLHESEVRENLYAAVAGEARSFSGPYRVHVSGREVVMNLRTAPLRSATGRLTGGVAVAEDTTEAWHLKERLQAQFKGIPVATYAWQYRKTPTGFDFVLVDFNDAADALARFQLAAQLGKGVHSGLSHPPSTPLDMLRSLQERKVIQREVQHVMNTTGEIKVFAVAYIPVASDMVLTHSEDITERRALEEKLRQSQKMEAVGQLAGGIAHDFNNLLTVIMSHCSLLLDDSSPGDARHADLIGIRRAADRAAQLTSQLLAFSRRQVLTPRSVDLNEVLTGLEPLLRRLLGSHIHVGLELAAGLDRVLADRGQLEQVVINLAVNARDAMPEGGKLLFATRRQQEPGAEVALHVTDFGVGMDRATQERIFEPFFTTKAPGRGTGLGLSTVYGIVQQSGGQIMVSSELGRGTTFSVTFPRLQRDASLPPVVAAEVEVRPGTETILLAEDLDTLRALCSRALRQRGYEVIVARDGRQALELAGQHTGAIHLLVTDMVMPVLGGRALFEALAQQRSELRVLYISGYTDDERLRNRELGPHEAFLQKPFTPAELVAAVGALLNHPAQ